MLHYLPPVPAGTRIVDFVIVTSVHALASGASASCVAAFLATRQRLCYRARRHVPGYGGTKHPSLSTKVIKCLNNLRQDTLTGGSSEVSNCLDGSLVIREDDIYLAPICGNLYREEAVWLAQDLAAPPHTPWSC